MSEDPSINCPSCGESVTNEQQWCLTCGARLLKRKEVRRPGWRSAFSITSLTILLVLGGSVAAYATLLKDAEGEGAKPAPPAANPAVAQAAPPQTPYDENQAAKRREQKKLPVVKNPLGNGSFTGGGGANGTNPSGFNQRFNSGGGPGTSGYSGGSAAPAKPLPVPVKLEPNDIEVFDPIPRVGAEYGDGEGTNNLIDSDNETFWNVNVPQDGENIRVGLLIEPRAPQIFAELSLKTFTPGFSMLIYATNSEDPPNDLADKHWKLLARGNKINSETKIALNKKIRGTSFRYLLIWFTKLGTKANKESAMIAVNELNLLAEPTASSTSSQQSNQKNDQTSTNTQTNTQQDENLDPTNDPTGK